MNRRIAPELIDQSGVETYNQPDLLADFGLALIVKGAL
jgi:hypothetical protein